MFWQGGHLFLTLAAILAVSQMFGGLSHTWLSTRWTRTVFLSTLGQVVALGVVGHLHWVASAGVNGSNLDTSALVRAFALALWSLVCLLLPSEPWGVLPPFADGGAWSTAALECGDPYRLALYAGATGFAVPFATAIAAMFGNNSDNSWARHTFGWAFAVWAWLSLAMALAIGLPASPWRGVSAETWEPVKSAAVAEWLASVALVYLLLPTTRRSTSGGWALLFATVLFPVAYLGILLVPIRTSVLYAWRLAMRGTV